MWKQVVNRTVISIDDERRKVVALAPPIEPLSARLVQNHLGSNRSTGSAVGFIRSAWRYPVRRRRSCTVDVSLAQDSLLPS